MPPATSMKTPVTKRHDRQTQKRSRDVSHNHLQLCRFHRAWIEHLCLAQWPHLHFKSAPTMAANHTYLQTTTAQSHSTRDCTAQRIQADIKTSIFRKVLDKKVLQYLTTAVFVQSLLNALSARQGPYLPYFQRWVWLGHCSSSHTPGISPRFYLGLPWIHSHENCKGSGVVGRNVTKLKRDANDERAEPFTPEITTETKLEQRGRWQTDTNVIQTNR